ncbi:ABC transporter ATP-binding protein [filamentous cyanobacterium CCP1]|nr:ABC transporter ATP-binding protein [filamentous cyanobacterium CCP2]PSB65821.1 ABC transporter ATP-binding protein [filamentous cyanobacterium CCP1]
MRLISFLARSSWQMLMIAILLGFLSGGSSAGLIAYVGRLMEQSMTQRSIGVIIIFLGLAAIALITNILSQMLLIRLAQQAIFRLRMTLSQQILAAELRHLEQVGNARLLATLTEDIQAIAEAVRLLPFICIDFATIAGCLFYIVWLSWDMALLVCGLAALSVTVYQWILKYAKRELALARDEQDNLFQHFNAITDGVKELKLHYRRRQVFLREELQSSAANYRHHSIKGLDLFAIIVNFGNFVLFFTLGLVLFVLPRLFTISFEIISTYLLLFTYMILPMQQLVGRLPVLIRAGVSLEKVESLNLSLIDRTEADAIPPAIAKLWTTLQLNGVTHTYQTDQDDSHFELGPIDLAIHPGELIFIVGGNGSGKSTLAKLITGLYAPEAGEICLNGKPIHSANQEWYRQHFSVIFSDFYLFDRLLGLDSFDLDQDAQTYLKQLQLDRKVRIEQGKLSTTSLSQGQRKRLALLTAYLEDRPIYLFDEWAADQDPVFKDLFYTQLLPDLRNQGKTIFVISHDDHYFHIGDRIIKLNYGKVEYDREQK